MVGTASYTKLAAVIQPCSTDAAVSDLQGFMEAAHRPDCGSEPPGPRCPSGHHSDDMDTIRDALVGSTQKPGVGPISSLVQYS